MGKACLDFFLVFIVQAELLQRIPLRSSHSCECPILRYSSRSVGTAQCNVCVINPCLFRRSCCCFFFVACLPRESFPALEALVPGPFIAFREVKCRATYSPPPPSYSREQSMYVPAHDPALDPRRPLRLCSSWRQQKATPPSSSLSRGWRSRRH